MNTQSIASALLELIESARDDREIVGIERATRAVARFLQSEIGGSFDRSAFIAFVGSGID